MEARAVEQDVGSVRETEGEVAEVLGAIIVYVLLQGTVAAGAAALLELSLLDAEVADGLDIVDSPCCAR